MICTNRKDADPAAVTCSTAMGGGKAVCACRLEVEAEVDPFSEVNQTAIGQARVPDSARGGTA